MLKWFVRILTVVGVTALIGWLGRVWFNIVKGPTTPVPLPANPYGFDCLPLGNTRPNGVRVKIVDANGKTTDYWDFSCDGLAQLERELKRIQQSYCVGGDPNTASGTVEDAQIDPYLDTGSNTKGVRLKAAHGDFFTPCTDLSQLIQAVQQAFSGCCL